MFNKFERWVGEGLERVRVEVRRLLRGRGWWFEFGRGWA